MSEQGFTRPRAVPTGPQAQQPSGEAAPDFLAYAHDQLRRAHLGVAEMAKKEDGGEGSREVIAFRLQIAQGYIALADIQYAIPDEEDPEGDEETGEIGGFEYERRRR
jgi:hypothetical protein